MEMSAVTHGYTITAGDNQPVFLLRLESTCNNVIPATPMTEHRSQSGKDAPKKTTEGAGEHPVRILVEIKKNVR